ncbi:hypothetical protein M404DRAFT_558648 [Pisolithus tinctorius Marx 270]|uniref:Uncharacterized protein n=1 Tax=Pisolithus tinctorius Marx 270 TaxID=870435 RepID=A0A0C3P992_PISTI|nr:hypothetical protein M404DRAFT_558648 [Pisolithus tinctorius Marx 270]
MAIIDDDKILGNLSPPIPGKPLLPTRQLSSIFVTPPPHRYWYVPLAVCRSCHLPSFPFSSLECFLLDPRGRE